MASALSLFNGAYRGKTVMVTGHTGFKGAWLTLWLERLGAKVVGFALSPPSAPNLFVDARNAEHLFHIHGDVRERQELTQAMHQFQPDMVFHLAAQSLVRPSYMDPVETYETNVMGTVNVLEAVRATPSVRACIVITSDKCYENQEWVYSYRENDPLGGYDPYSSSKGCAELVTSAYRRSFFHPDRMEEHQIALASVRAGNVIGGGDWAVDRIVPDCIRALMTDTPIVVRNPRAIRPWQHVLEPLSGYLWLGARMLETPARFAECWNFGPPGTSNVPVQRLVETILDAWEGGTWVQPESTAQLHEAHFLKLDITKATNILEWQPVYDFKQTLETTVAWYAAYHRDSTFDARAFTLRQIEAYEREAALRGLHWANVSCEVA